MLRAGHPYYVMDLHTSINSSGGYTIHPVSLRALDAGLTISGHMQTPDLTQMSPEDKKKIMQKQQAVAREQIVKIYGGYIDNKRVESSNVLVDPESAWSLSWGCDTYWWITELTDLLRPVGDDGLKAPFVPLSIMDAGAGCGGDTMQFMTANFTDDANQIHKVFHTVTAVEMDPTRAHYLLRNTQLVRRAYNVRDEPNILEEDYSKLMREIRDDAKLPKYTHDVLYLDPPWGGKSSDDKRQESLYMYKKTEMGESSKPYEPDTDMGIDTIVAKILEWNDVLHKNGQTKRQTKVIVLKTPKLWNCAMRDKTRRMVPDCVVVGGQRNDFFLYFLRDIEAQDIRQVGYTAGDLTKGMCKGFESWETQQANIIKWFSTFPENDSGQKMFSPERPMFLQDVWLPGINHYDRNNKPKNTSPYLPGQRHGLPDMHNGEAKLLSSSLFTIMYGLTRAYHEMENMRTEYNALLQDQNHSQMASFFHEPFDWNYVLQNTIVLYIGAGGLNRKTHHFNELLLAIPTVQFVCYDIRHVECDVSPANQARITVFHKMFTETDAQRWATFSDVYPHKNVIVISDIRSDWEQARLECEASKSVLMKKMYQLKLLSEVAKQKATRQTQDKVQNEYLNKSDEGSIRSQIDQLTEENREAEVWIDEIVKRDSYVQWDWCALMCNKQVDASTKPRTTCAVFSVKTREPYQTVKHAARELDDFYITVPGLELFQKFTRNSTETRTQVSSEHYALRFPRQYSPPVEARDGYIETVPVWYPGKVAGFPGRFVNTQKRHEPVKASKGYFFIPPRANWTVMQCLNKHFKSRGDAHSFATERVDYQKSLGGDADPNSRFRFNPTRSVLLHDMYFAHYNLDWDHTHQKKAVDDGIQHMYNKFYTLLQDDGVNFGYTNSDGKVLEWTNKTLTTWLKTQDKKLLEQKPRHVHFDINLDSMINKDSATNTTMMIRTMRMPPAETKKWNAAYLTRFFGTKQTLIQYDWHLMWQAKKAQTEKGDNPGMWDQSQQAMEALLVLNMNLRTSPASKNATTNTMLAYQSQGGTKMKQFIEKYKDTFVPPPPDWFSGQLRFNLTRPFVAELYNKHLQHRYDHIKEYMDSPEVLAQMIPPANVDAHGVMAEGSILAAKPGSAATDVDFDFMKRMIHTRYTHAAQHLTLPRDWYCYWLQPLLLNRDAYTQIMNEKLNEHGSMQQLGAAVEPYMVWQGHDKGYGLSVRSTDPTTNKFTQDVLQLEKWPQGKPVLYYACEQGCLSMLKFCLLDLTDEAIKRKINRPRMKVMKDKDPNHMNPDELNNYNDIAMDQDNTRKKQSTVGTVQAENYPLHIAAWNGQLAIVKHLCTLGADHRRRNFWGETPAQCAKLALGLTNKQNLFKDDDMRIDAIKQCIDHLYTVEQVYIGEYEQEQFQRIPMTEGGYVDKNPTGQIPDHIREMARAARQRAEDGNTMAEDTNDDNKYTVGEMKSIDRGNERKSTNFTGTYNDKHGNPHRRKTKNGELKKLMVPAPIEEDTNYEAQFQRIPMTYKAV